MKILNLYSGIGGNRAKWGDLNVTAVEYDEAIVSAYAKRFPKDTVIVADAKQYLLDHYKEFDFIWASPPCQTHTAVRKCRVDTNPMTNTKGVLKAVYPDMTLWQIIIFLEHHAKCNYVVENVVPYYKTLIKESVSIDRHLYWSNFNIPKIDIKKDKNIEKTTLSDMKDFDITVFKGIKNKQQVIRNQVNSDVGEYILRCSTGTVKHRQGGLFD